MSTQHILLFRDGDYEERLELSVQPALSYVAANSHGRYQTREPVIILSHQTGTSKQMGGVSLPPLNKKELAELGHMCLLLAGEKR